MKVLKIERTKVVAIVEANNKKGNFPLLGTKYKVDLQMAKNPFPLFSTELEQDREILLDKYQSFWGDEEKTENGNCSWRKWFKNAVNSYHLF